MSEIEEKKAHDLISEYADADNMGRLRSAIATALTSVRAETWDAAIGKVRTISTGCWGADLGDTKAKVLREVIVALEAAKDGR